jgi:hypothetical protein
MAQAVDITQFALAVEDFLRPFSGDAEALRKGAEKLDDLRDVVVVLTVFGAGLWVEKIVAGNQFEDLTDFVSARIFVSYD